MDFRSLRCALTAAEHLSFRAAAKSLGIGQAALSRRIRALEDEIGVSIFERRREGVRVTVAGREFLAQIRSAISTMEYAAEHAKVAGRAETGSLTIAFYQPLATSRLQTLLASYRAEWTEVRLNFMEMDNRISSWRCAIGGSMWASCSPSIRSPEWTASCCGATQHSWQFQRVILSSREMRSCGPTFATRNSSCARIEAGSSNTRVSRNA